MDTTKAIRRTPVRPQSQTLAAPWLITLSEATPHGVASLDVTVLKSDGKIDITYPEKTGGRSSYIVQLDIMIEFVDLTWNVTGFWLSRNAPKKDR